MWMTENDVLIFILDLIFFISLWKLILEIMFNIEFKHLEKKWANTDFGHVTTHPGKDGYTTVSKLLKIRKGDKIFVKYYHDHKAIGIINKGIFGKQVIINCSHLSDKKIVSINNLIDRIINSLIVIAGICSFILNIFIGFGRISIVFIIFASLTGLLLLTTIIPRIVTKVINLKSENDFIVDINNSSIITGYKGKNKRILSIPHKIKGVTINQIDSLNFLNIADYSKFVSIIIPNSVKYINYTNPIFWNKYNECTLSIICIGANVEFNTYCFGDDFYSAYNHYNKQGGKYSKIVTNDGEIYWSYDG